VLLQLLGKILLLGLEMHGTLHPLYSSLSTPLSWLCGFWGKYLYGFTNSFLLNDHSTCNGGKTSWCNYMDFLTSFFSLGASKCFVGLGKSYCHSSSEINLWFCM
jgi:hypothetical protein